MGRFRFDAAGVDLDQMGGFYRHRFFDLDEGFGAAGDFDLDEGF